MTVSHTMVVVDASVAIQLFVHSPLSAAAETLFAQLADDPPADLVVPDLFYIEIANVLWKYVRWQGLPLTQAHDHLQQLARLNLQPVSTAHLMTDALTQAARLSITAYDACYLALAQRLDVPLVTADTRLAAAIGTAGQVQFLR